MYEVLKHVLNVNNPSSNPVEANLQFFSVKYDSKNNNLVDICLIDNTQHNGNPLECFMSSVTR